jgi:predicted kinase
MQPKYSLTYPSLQRAKLEASAALKAVSTEVTERELSEISVHLDAEYHAPYSSARRTLHLSIVNRLLESQEQGKVAKNGSRKTVTTIVCVGGPIASGKSYLIDWMRQRDYLPSPGALIVDMDDIRNFLPESDYLKHSCPEAFGERTQKEAGTVAELLVHCALRRGRSVIIDSSMVHLAWQETFLTLLRELYRQTRVLLIHVSAHADSIRSRSLYRGQSIKRIVPNHLLEKSMKTVSISISR